MFSSNENATEEVIKALEDDRFKWRTIKGIATAARISPTKVEAVLQEQQDKIVRSSINGANGEALYATRRHFKKKSSFGEKIMAAMRNRIA
jgi:hypothetical protein